VLGLGLGTLGFMQVTKTAEDTFRFPAWVGDRERLARIGAALDDLIAPLRESAMRTAVEDAKSLAYLDGDYPDQRRSQAESDWSVEVEAREPTLSTTYRGELDAVLGDIDARSIESVRIVAPKTVHTRTRVAVNFDQADGCTVEVRADDPTFVRAASMTLRDEIKRSVPRWAWARTELGASIYGALLVVPLLTAVFMVTEGTGDWNAAQWAFSPFLGFVLGVIPIAGIVFIVRRFLLPGFEMVGANEHGRGARIVGMAGILAFEIALVAIGAVID
jgi:hypothetical protein